jgi:glycogen(starch) synthase
MFFPQIGGVETVSMILAEEFTRVGAKVTVITGTPGAPMRVPYSVVRQPSLRDIYRLAKASDIVFQNMFSMKTLLGSLPTGTPVVVTHASWIRYPGERPGLHGYMQLLGLPFCHNLAVSQMIADSLPVKSSIIGNPFETLEFAGPWSKEKDRDIVFMGRLAPEKGCDLLLHALASLRSNGLTPSLTIIGGGSEMAQLMSLTTELRLEEQVEFLGSMDKGRGEIVARHRVIAIPSLYAEPFGVVALEGIAAGCAVVASSKGGLPFAAGPCGLYFQNGDVDALANQLHRVLTEPELHARLVSNGPNHLKQFRPDVIASQYLKLFRSLVERT